MTGKNKKSHADELADLRCEIATLNECNAIACRRPENAEKRVVELSKTNDRLSTGIRYSLDRLSAFNLMLATRPISDGDRITLMLLDGVMAPVKGAYRGHDYFLPQVQPKKES